MMSFQNCSGKQKKLYSDVQELFNTCHKQKTIFEHTDAWPGTWNLLAERVKNKLPVWFK
jgi:hypothetical protein